MPEVRGISWKNTKDSRTVSSERLQDRQQWQDELAVVVMLLQQRVEYFDGVQRLHLRCKLLVRLGHLYSGKVSLRPIALNLRRKDSEEEECLPGPIAKALRARELRSEWCPHVAH